MKVTNELKIYEINGQEEKGTSGPYLVITSHWCFNDRVEIKAPNGDRFVVISDELIRAIRNSENHK